MTATPLADKKVFMGPSPVVVYRSATDIVVANSAAEADAFRYTVPGGVVTGNAGVRVTLWGDRFNNSGGDVNTIVRFYIGATEVWQHNQTHGTGATHAPWWCQFEIYAKDSDAVQEMLGRLSVHNVGAPTTGQGSMQTGLSADAVIYGSAAEDMTVDQDVAVTVDMDTASANATWTTRRITVENIE